MQTLCAKICRNGIGSLMPCKSIGMCSHTVPFFPCGVVLAESGSGEAFIDCFVSIMVCSLGVTTDGRRDIRQGVSCGKEVLNDFRNTGTSRCVSLEDASASILSTPVMRDMYTWIFAWRVIHAALRRRGAMSVAVLTMPLWSQLSAAVLLTPVAMCSRDLMGGAKSWRWAMYAASSRLLMVKNPWGFSSVRMLACMAVLNVSRHTCHSPAGLYQTLPMPVMEVSVEPIHVGGFGLIALRCVGLDANDATRWRHKVSSAWTSVDRFIRRPLAAMSACQRQVNIPAAPAVAGTVLRRVPSSLCQRRREHHLALGEMVLSRAKRLLLRSSGRMKNCLTVLIAQLRTTFCMLQAASPLRIFLRKIGSSCAVSSLIFGQKSLMMPRKRCRVIFLHLSGLLVLYQ